MELNRTTALMSLGPHSCVQCCTGCLYPIMDQFYLCVGEQTWHQHCLNCTICHSPLVDRCFFRNGCFFCHNDFIQHFSPPCTVCLQSILPTDLVRFAGNMAFHVTCFRCAVCSRQLATGDECRFLGNGQSVICLNHQYPKYHDCSIPTSSSDEKLKGEGLESIMSGPFGTAVSEKVFDDRNISAKQDKPPSIIKDMSKFVKQIELNPSSSGMNAHPKSLEELRSPGWSAIGEESTEDLKYSSNAITASKKNSIDFDDLAGFMKGEDGEKDSIIQRDDGDEEDEEEDEEADEEVDEDEGLDGDDSPQSQNQMNTTNDEEGQIVGVGLLTKRRGPRTTIKAKQLETLKSAFSTTPKPTRHIREQLAQETGLSMRVIQVWFQNRRSKERRMKQLSALGVRRPFFRHSRRMRSLRTGFNPEDIAPDVVAELFNMPSYNGLLGDSHNDFYGAMAVVAASGIAFGPSMLPYGTSSLFPPGFLTPSIDSHMHHLEPPPGSIYHPPLLSLDLIPPPPPPHIQKLLFQDSFSPQSLSPAMEMPRFSSSGLHLTTTSTPNRDCSSPSKKIEFSGHSGVVSGDEQTFFGDNQCLHGKILRNPLHEPTSGMDLYHSSIAPFPNIVKNETVPNRSGDPFSNLPTIDSGEMNDSNYCRTLMSAESFRRPSSSALKEQQAYGQSINQGLVGCSW